VVDAIWSTIEPLLPAPDQSHPLGCHRPRISDRLCLSGILIRMVTGGSWVDIEAILGHQVSDTTLRTRLAEFGLDDLDIQRRRPRDVDQPKQPMWLGLRWIVEGTNSWWSNYDQLRRNTDRSKDSRHAAPFLATTILIIGKLLTYRDRWSPT
jgi:transposase